MTARVAGFARRIGAVLTQPMTSRLYAMPPPSKPLPSVLESMAPGEMAHPGERNPGKTFYVIWREYPGSGFFSNVFHVLLHLEKAWSLDMEPVVDFQNFVTLYNEDEEIAGTRNAWEYYFRPVSAVSLEEVYDSQRVFLCDGKYPSGSSHDGSHRDRLREVFDRFVSVRSDIEQSVQDWMAEFGKKTLGVHFRGQEQNRAASHPFGPTERQMLSVTTRVLEEEGFDRLFVVTEDQGYLELFQREFGDIVLATDSYRTRNENAYRTFPRPLHRYLLGREVLVDSLLLSRCQGLVAGRSNVSHFAQLMNGGRFERVSSIWNGVNSANPLAALYLYGLRKRLPVRWGGLPGTLWESGRSASGQAG